MLVKQLPIETIMECTGLNQIEIEEIKSSIWVKYNKTYNKFDYMIIFVRIEKG